MDTRSEFEVCTDEIEAGVTTRTTFEGQADYFRRIEGLFRRHIDRATDDAKRTLYQGVADWCAERAQQTLSIAALGLRPTPLVHRILAHFVGSR